MRRQSGKNKSLFTIWNYLIFFLMVSFIVTCCFTLFLHSMELSKDMIQRGAILTLGNVFLLSLLFAISDGIRRKQTMERPVKRILEATEQMARGNFNTRIEPLRGWNEGNELDIIIHNLNRMAGELSGIETLRTDFVANVSHEIKTPLSIIQNYADLLQTEELTAEQRTEYARAISAASRRLTDLVGNILKLNKLENQQIYPETKEYNLSEQICECLLQFEDIWEKKELEIDTDIEDDVMVLADPELLSLVWSNLFSNAMKFTEPGGLVAVSLKTEDDRAVIAVRDTGCGMSPDVGRHIFEKFYQGDRSHSMQGNGLGLALVKRVVDITGGEISVESTLGEGSIFTVKLRRNLR